CATGGRLVALIKPQFEAKKSEVDAGKGVIRDKAIHERVVQEIQSFAYNELTGAQLIGTMVSPIKGTDGNLEFLIGLQKRS
ncbi:MAG: SAM-dependent methyltransferase, partial [Verrucomicrobiota bacterium]|nr:SAM-dependent methyltransferase [Verrucomicrobiota bacterium]